MKSFLFALVKMGAATVRGWYSAGGAKTQPSALTGEKENTTEKSTTKNTRTMLARAAAVVALAGSAAAFSPVMSMELGRRQV